MAKASVDYLYGLNPAFESLIAGRRRFSRAYLNENTSSSGRLGKLAAIFDEKGIPVESVDKGRLTQLAGSHEHQGVVLRSSLYPYVTAESIIEEHPSLCLLLDNLEDPHNVGAILRSAEVFGCQHVFLPVKGVPEVYPSVVKVSAGASEHMKIARDRAANQYARLCAEAGYTLVALDAKGKDDLMTVASPLVSAGQPILLVVGGEDKGVGQFILNMAHNIVKIPQAGRINSLNASVAAAIALHALCGGSRS